MTTVIPLQMNASGVIEQGEDVKHESKPEFVPKSSGVPPSASRYRRLAESRSITPSPTPLQSELLDQDREEEGFFKVCELLL